MIITYNHIRAGLQPGSRFKLQASLQQIESYIVLCGFAKHARKQDHVGTINQDVRIAQVRSSITQIKIDKTDGLGKDCLDWSGRRYTKRASQTRKERAYALRCTFVCMQICTPFKSWQNLPRLSTLYPKMSMSRSQMVINGG